MDIYDTNWGMRNKLANMRKQGTLQKCTFEKYTCSHCNEEQVFM